MATSLMVAVVLSALTPAGAQEAFSFTVVGDTQGDDGGVNLDVVPQLIDDMNVHDPAFGLFCGDLVDGVGGSVADTQAQWENWIAVTAHFNGEIYAVPGNHDYYGGVGTEAAWRDTFDWLPSADSPPGQERITYSFEYGNSLFVSISTDSAFGYSPPVHQDWLDDTLAAAGGYAHRFVFSHHTISFSAAEVLGGTAGDFWQSMVLNDVDAYFSGHWHRYQPSQLGAGGATWETVVGTGGGWQGFEPIRPYQQIHGFLLVEVDGPVATATFYGDADGDGHYDDALDDFTIRYDGDPPTGLVARYDFDSGSSAIDTAPPPLGGGIHGRLLGGARIMGAGLPRGRVLAVDGNQDGVEAGAIGDYILSLNEDLTLSAFVRIRSFRDQYWDNVVVAYGTEDYYVEDEQSNYSYWLSFQSDRTLVAFWEYEDGTNVTLESTEPAALGSGPWYHLAMTRDIATMEARFFVDGVQLGDPVPFDRLPTGGGRGMLYMGRDVAGASYFMDGQIDDVCIYNEVLTDDIIGQIAAGLPCPE